MTTILTPCVVIVRQDGADLAIEGRCGAWAVVGCAVDHCAGRTTEFASTRRPE